MNPSKTGSGKNGKMTAAELIAKCGELFRNGDPIPEEYNPRLRRLLPAMTHVEAGTVARNFGASHEKIFTRRVLKAGLVLGENFFWEMVKIGEKSSRGRISKPASVSVFSHEDEKAQNIPVSAV